MIAAKLYKRFDLDDFDNHCSIIGDAIVKYNYAIADTREAIVKNNYAITDTREAIVKNNYAIADTRDAFVKN
ncbi:MAG: hypothetical protein WCL14_14735, partial [Bacteroidota bacterium]